MAQTSVANKVRTLSGCNGASSNKVTPLAVCRTKCACWRLCKPQETKDKNAGLMIHVSCVGRCGCQCAEMEEWWRDQIVGWSVRMYTWCSLPFDTWRFLSYREEAIKPSHAKPFRRSSLSSNHLSPYYDRSSGVTFPVRAQRSCRSSFKTSPVTCSSFSSTYVPGKLGQNVVQFKRSEWLRIFPATILPRLS